MKKTTTKKKVESVGDYTVSLKVFGKDYSATGVTLKEAFEALNYTGKIGGNPLLTVSHGDNKKERVINGIMANRLFSTSRIMKEIAIKNMCTIFDNL